MRLPKLPGFRNPRRIEYTAVNVERLERKFEDGAVDVYKRQVVQRSTLPPARMSSRPSVFSNVDLPPLPIIAVMPGSILSAEARLPLTVSICSPPYNTVIINNHQSSGRTAFALLKP